MTLYFVFTVQEELGLRGSKPAAYGIDPDYGIAVDVTAAEELDDTHRGSTVLGGGAAIKIMDSSVICHPNVVKMLEDLGLSSKIPCQKDVLIAGERTPDRFTSAVVVSRQVGFRSRCRYIHSPVEMVSLEDVSAADPPDDGFCRGKTRNYKGCNVICLYRSAREFAPSVRKLRQP
ncbi:MAG: hypothetical protein ACLUNZ_02940 [Evtepia sp.]